MRKLIIVGCGPGHREYLTAIAEKKIREAQVLIGPNKLLENFPEFPGERIALQGNYRETTGLLLSWYKEKNTVVLVTGDPGIYSYARIIIETVGPENCEIIPGISSIQLAFARLGMTWDDAVIISLHGKQIEDHTLIDQITRHPKLVLLTDEENSAARISQLLSQYGIKRRPAYICQDLSLPTEQIWQTDTIEMAKLKPNPLNLIIILNTQAEMAIHR